MFTSGRIGRGWLVVLCITMLETSIVCGGEHKFIVHEWGTFTTLQNDAGQELPGINIDDEPVPAFVHNLSPYLLNNAVLSNQHWIYRQKGAPRQHPRVTMRLETPVIYFYPDPVARLPKEVDVEVHFRGGWLTEFYPLATADMPGLEQDSFDFGPLTPSTIGKLKWSNVRLDTHTAGPETSENVWLAPRNVKAVDLSVDVPATKDGATSESERYLFYRGVANQQAPLRVSTHRDTQQLALHANFQDALAANQTATIAALWLVDIRSDGQVAFRTLNPLTVNSDRKKELATTSYAFSAGDYASGNLTRLREAMHSALVKDGLYEDEATAMLHTWQRAYFQSPGLRLFFLVPQVWTDHYLPLTISGKHTTSRVMMGRIELISEAQREQLATIAKGPVSKPDWINRIPEGENKERFLAGRSQFGDLEVKIPEDYQAYLRLGRFRNALVIAAAQEKTATAQESLALFVNRYRLQPYRWNE